MKLLPVLSLAIAGCAQLDPEVGVVAALRVPCNIGSGSSMCLMLDGQIISEGIIGYEHRWGVSSTVRYHREEIDNPAADESSIKYVLDAIVDESPAVTQFEVAFPTTPPGTEWFEATNQATELRMFGTRVLCDAPTCAAILERADALDAFVVDFELTAEVETLRAAAVN